MSAPKPVTLVGPLAQGSPWTLSQAWRKKTTSLKTTSLKTSRPEGDPNQDPSQEPESWPEAEVYSPDQLKSRSPDQVQSQSSDWVQSPDLKQKSTVLTESRTSLKTSSLKTEERRPSYKNDWQNHSISISGDKCNKAVTLCNEMCGQKLCFWLKDFTLWLDLE